MLRSITFALTLSAATVALAQSPEDQAACQDDAFRYCSQTIPDRDRTFQCMMANRDVLSAACRTVITRHMPEPPPQHSKKAAARRAKKGHGPVNLNPTAAR